MKRLLFLISSLIIGAALLITYHAHASIHFQQFNLADYSTNQLSREELVSQIQTFTVRILPKIENCNERGEVEFQDIFCTNIYEADRIRLAYLLGYNANMQPQAIIQTNKIRKIIFPRDYGAITDTDTTGTEETEYTSGYKNDFDDSITNPHKIKKKPYYDHLSSDFKLGMAVENSLRSCAIENTGQSQLRLRVLNPQLGLKKDPNDSTNSYALIGCQDMKLVLKQFLSQANINHILDHSPKIEWLNFTESEKINLQLSQQEIDQANSTILSDSEYQDIKSKCAVTGLQALLICPAMRATGGFIQAGLNIIQKSMVLNPKFTNSRTKGGHVLYLSWAEFRNISNLILIIGFMLMIAAYVTNRQLDLYQVRKMLPKFAIITILINVSFLMMQLAVDISNLTGKGLFDILSEVMPFDYDIMKTVSTVLAGGLLVGAVVIAPFIGIAMLIPVIISSMLSVVVMVVLLALRDSAFIILLVLTPPALISLMFPKSDRFYQIWKQSMWMILLIPPLVGFMFGSGKFLSGLMFRLGGLMQIFYIIPLALQFYLLPKILLNALKNLPLIGNQVTSTISKVPDIITDKYRSSEFHKQSVMNFKAKRNRSIMRAKFDKQHPLSSSAYLAANRLNQGKNQLLGKVVPGYDILTQAPDFDREAFQELVDNATKMDPNVAKYYLMEMDIMKKPNLSDYQKGLNSLSTEASTQLKTMLNNNNPDQIVSSLLKVSDDGEGDAEAMLQGFKQYLQNGGDYANLSSIAKIIEANYKKEAKFADAAQFNKINKAAKTSKVDYQAALNQLQQTSKADQIAITSDYFLTVNNWNKFKGFGQNSVEDKAFRQFFTDPSTGKFNANRQAQFASIQTQAAQNNQANQYLNTVFNDLQ